MDNDDEIEEDNGYTQMDAEANDVS